MTYSHAVLILAITDSEYYIPVTRTVNGKKVKALRIATGAGPYTAAYAYKTKALVK